MNLFLQRLAEAASCFGELLWGFPVLPLMLFTGALYSARSGFFQLTGAKTWFGRTAGGLYQKAYGQEKKIKTPSQDFTRFQPR